MKQWSNTQTDYTAKVPNEGKMPTMETLLNETQLEALFKNNTDKLNRNYARVKAYGNVL